MCGLLAAASLCRLLACSDSVARRALPRTGDRTLALRHCQADSAISTAAVHSKQEALQLHSVLEGAQRAADGGEHGAVVAALAPVLLCCSDKEQQMLQLDQQQWLRGMGMLLAAAGATQAWGLALRCHLRLLNALLPQVPPQALALIQGGEQQPSGGALLPALLPAAEQLAQQPAAAGALKAAAAFLHRHGPQLALSSRGRAASGGAGGSGGSGAAPSCVVELHSMEAAMYEAVQRQLAVAVTACSVALAAAGGAAAQSQLNMKASGGGCLGSAFGRSCFGGNACWLQLVAATTAARVAQLRGFPHPITQPTRIPCTPRRLPRSARLPAMPEPPCCA